MSRVRILCGSVKARGQASLRNLCLMQDAPFQLKKPQQFRSRFCCRDVCQVSRTLGALHMGLSIFHIRPAETSIVDSARLNSEFVGNLCLHIYYTKRRYQLKQINGFAIKLFRAPALHQARLQYLKHRYRIDIVLY
jgi:hypothetical protein